MKCLMTGGSGLLGRHLKIKADRPSHEELDITQTITYKQGYGKIVHCAGYTDVARAEIDKKGCFDVNVVGTLNLLEAYPNIPIVLISSEYAHNPVNFYSITKSLAEQIVLYRGNCLIIRTLFKPRPWEYDKAFIDQWTQGDYVDVIAPLVDREIKEWKGGGKRLVYVGTGRKLIYDLARQTRDVGQISVDDIKNVRLPKDYA